MTRGTAADAIFRDRKRVAGNPLFPQKERRSIFAEEKEQVHVSAEANRPGAVRGGGDHQGGAARRRPSRPSEQGPGQRAGPVRGDHFAHAQRRLSAAAREAAVRIGGTPGAPLPLARSEEHTSELQSLMRNSYAVFCLKNKN